MADRGQRPDLAAELEEMLAVGRQGGACWYVRQVPAEVRAAIDAQVGRRAWTAFAKFAREHGAPNVRPDHIEYHYDRDHADDA